MPVIFFISDGEYPNGRSKSPENEKNHSYELYLVKQALGLLGRAATSRRAAQEDLTDAARSRIRGIVALPFGSFNSVERV